MASDIFTGVLMPLLLCGAGVYFTARARTFWFLHPIRYIKTLREAEKDSGTSPAAALSTALAGTLGVGNISGVATAITAGGAGAILWMLIGALCAMGVKYAEVALAVRYRRTRQTNGRTEFFGGAPYYIRDGIGRRAKSKSGRRMASVLAVVFALLCAANAAMTGTVVQVYAAREASGLSPLFCAVLFCVLSLPFMRRGIDALSRLTVWLIPSLALLYLFLSGAIVLSHAAEIPQLLCRIVSEAFSPAAILGGAAGCTVCAAIRYGITRGLLSNEAGCGTAPTAHAAADVRSARHQACYGVFEVFLDTVVLCSATALVILLYRDGEGLDGITLAVTAYTRLSAALWGEGIAGIAAGFLRGSVVLFAWASVLCQGCYGVEALRFLLREKAARRLWYVIAVGAIFAGAFLSPRALWLLADTVLAWMTVLNVGCVLYLRREVG